MRLLVLSLAAVCLRSNASEVRALWVTRFEYRTEAEVRAILDAAVNVPEHNFLLSLHAVMAEAGGLDLEVPPRTDQPRPVDLS